MHREPQVVELVQYFKPPIGERSFYRRKADVQNVRWLGPWPPKRDQRPPWEGGLTDSPAEHAVNGQVVKQLRLLCYEDDGTIRPVQFLVEGAEGKLRLIQRLVPAFLVLRGALTLNPCALHLPVHLHHVARVLIG